MIPAKKLSNDENLEVNVVISRKNKDSDFPKLLISYLKTLNATYGAKVRGSVFKMKFRVFSREFESIETFLGFAQLLGEKWV